MAVLIDKGLLLAFGVFLAVWQGGMIEPVAATLVGVIVAALGSYITEKKKKELLVAAAVAFCFFMPPFLCFLPVVFYECAEGESAEAAGAMAGSAGGALGDCFCLSGLFGSADRAEPAA